MRWITAETASLERELLAALSRDALWRHLEGVTRWQRVSGTPEEMEAARYVADTLRAYGADTEFITFDAYVSLPQSASLTVLEPVTQVLPCITHAFAASTPPGGVTGELVDVGSADPQAYRSEQVAGRIALGTGLGMPHKAWALEQSGAVGQIYIHGEQVHELIVTTIWGTPTPESAARLPKTPVVSVSGSAGAQLQSLLRRGPVRVKLETEVWTGWRPTPIVVGTLAGAQEPDRFVLLSCHLDSWYYGAMDNGAANAIALELVRLLAARRRDLRRSLRVAFWPGHSNARYAGSTWYADHRWQELHDACVVHVNIESPGAKGSVYTDELVTMAANRQFAVELFEELTGTRPVGRRFGRTGEQSFWGTGVPALFVTVSTWPPEDLAPATSGVLGHMTVGGAPGGLPWWWHTAHDTIDKIDPDCLHRDARIYLATVLRLCNAPVLPFQPVATAEEILDVLRARAQQAGGRFDLGPLVAQAEVFRAAAAVFQEAASRLAAQMVRDADAAARRDPCRAINDALMKVDRALIPVCFTLGDSFDQDPAVPLPPVPGLHGLERLPQLPADSDEARFLHTRLVRESNRLAQALRDGEAGLKAAAMPSLAA